MGACDELHIRFTVVSWARRAGVENPPSVCETHTLDGFFAPARRARIRRLFLLRGCLRGRGSQDVWGAIERRRADIARLHCFIVQMLIISRFGAYLLSMAPHTSCDSRAHRHLRRRKYMRMWARRAGARNPSSVCVKRIHLTDFSCQSDAPGFAYIFSCVGACAGAGRRTCWVVARARGGIVRGASEQGAPLGVTCGKT